MILENTFLNGIQAIPGHTPAEKYKSIKLTARQIADKKCDSKVFTNSLVPLLNVESAKILNDTTVIIEALLSDNALLCQRALQISDLFSNQNSPLLDWDYFNVKLLSQVSLVTRFKLIKKVSQDLKNKDPKYSETFYLGISNLYGRKYAFPLLLACSENFINKEVGKHTFFLSHKYLKKLLPKCPGFIFTYLNPTKQGCMQFIPSLIDNHFDVFVDFLEKLSKNCVTITGIKLGKRRTKQFLEKGTDVLINNPKLYLNLLIFKVVVKRLSEDEFIQMLSGLLPNNLADFNYSSVSYFIRHITDDKKLTFITSAFHKAYNKFLYDCPEQICEHLLVMLPTEERYRHARIKLEEDSDWNLSDYRISWRSYLPFEEFFEDYKDQIAKRLDTIERRNLICLMIFNCSINNNKKALLKVLHYIEKRQKNEKVNILSYILNFLFEKFGTFDLDQSHWNVLFLLIKRMETLEKYRRYADRFQKWIVKAMEFRIQHNLPIDECVYLFIKITINISYVLFNCGFDDERERLILEKCMNILEEVYTDDIKYKINKMRVVGCLLKSVSNFNFECKNKEKKYELLNIESSPSFIHLIETIVLPSHNSYEQNLVKEYTKTFNYNLYKKWFPNDKIEVPPNNIKCDLNASNLLQNLKKDYSKIFNELAKYLDILMASTKHRDFDKFLKAVRWYKDLPIKFAEASLKQLDESKNYQAIVVLSVLIDGNKYEELINPLIPWNVVMDLNDKDKLKFHELITNSMLGMKLTDPPITLSIIQRLFSDYFIKAKSSLYKIANRTSIPKVVKFCTINLLHKRVAVTREMIFLLFLLAPVDDIIDIFKKLLETNSNQSIHAILVEKSDIMFTLEPNDRNWHLLLCFLRANVIEDTYCLRILASDVNKVHIKYVASYINEVIRIFECTQIKRCPNLSTELLTTLFRNLDNRYAEILSTEFQQDIIQKYFFDSMLDPKKPKLQVDFLFEVYLNGEDITKKITFLSDHLLTFFVKHIGKPFSTNNSKLIPIYIANKLLNRIIYSFVTHSASTKVNMVMLNNLQHIFNSVVKPQQDVSSFLYLTWIKEFEVSITPKEFGIIFGRNIDSLANTLGKEYFVHITDIIKNFLDTVYYDMDSDERNYSFIEGLLETKCNDAYIFAAKLINFSDAHTERRKSIIAELLKTDIPSVEAILWNDILWNDTYSKLIEAVV